MCFEVEWSPSAMKRTSRDLLLGPLEASTALFDLGLIFRLMSPRSGHHDELIIRRHLRPAFGELKLRSLSVDHIDAFAVERQHLDPKTLSNHLTFLGSMLRVAVDLDWLDRVPRIRKPRVRIISSDFSYLRTDEEIERFLRAAVDEGKDAFVLYATTIYTGMREGELAGQRLSHQRWHSLSRSLRCGSLGHGLRSAP